MSEHEKLVPQNLSSLAKAGGVDGHALSVPSTPVSGTLNVGIVDCSSFTRDCIALSIENLGGHLSGAESIKIEKFASCDDISGSETCFDTIMCHLQGSPGENLADLRKLTETAAAVIVLSPNESIGAVRAAFESGARGYIPSTNTGLDLLIKVLPFVNAGGTYVPPSILAPAELSQKHLQGLTEREELILDLLKKGKPNKIIAYELGLSESTVKVHIRNILTKLRVHNRTEAVSAAMRRTPNKCGENGKDEHFCLERQLDCQKPVQEKSVKGNVLAVVPDYNQPRQAARFRTLAETATTPTLKAQLLKKAADFDRSPSAKAAPR